MAEALKHEELTERIIKVFYTVYNELGHGFLESVYEESMDVCFRELGIKVVRQAVVPVWFRGQKVGEFRADFIVEDLVLLELISCALFRRLPSRPAYELSERH